jgi:hypothetical protein
MTDIPWMGWLSGLRKVTYFVPLFSLEPEVGQTTVGYSSVANSTASMTAMARADG